MLNLLSVHSFVDLIINCLSNCLFCRRFSLSSRRGNKGLFCPVACTAFDAPGNCGIRYAFRIAPLETGFHVYRASSVLYPGNTEAAAQIDGWHTSWLIFAAYSLVVAILFFLIFKNNAPKSNVNPLKATDEDPAGLIDAK